MWKPSASNAIELVKLPTMISATIITTVSATTTVVRRSARASPPVANRWVWRHGVKPSEDMLDLAAEDANRQTLSPWNGIGSRGFFGAGRDGIALE